MARWLAMVAALVAGPALAQGRGVPVGGFPSWQERMIQVYTNRARADPVTELAGCSGCAEKACYTTALTPLVWLNSLNRSARFHAANLEFSSCFAHNSPCTVVSTINTTYIPSPGTCLGEPSCACTGGTASCSTSGTNPFDRMNAFGAAWSAAGENIAYNFSAAPRTAFDQWIFESDASTACGFRSTNGHRASILSASYNSVGCGYYSVSRQMYVQDFTNLGSATGTLISGGHDPQFTAAAATSINFRVNYYDTRGGPQSATLNVDGTCTSMAQERGMTNKNATWLSTVSLTGTACRRYVFEFKDPAGVVVRLPQTGTYGVGGSLATCPDYAAAAPVACGATNAAPTIATPAAGAPSPVVGTAAALSVLGADDNGEPALLYTWSVTGPAAVTFSANGTNAAKTTTATFTQPGTYQFTVTIKDAGNLSVTSTVQVTVQQSLTTITVSPPTATLAVGATQTFTATAKDQFGVALSSPPTFAWTTSGGGTISAGGVFTAGASPGGPFTVSATASAKTGTASVSVSAGNAPTVATAASATPSPVSANTTALSVLGADDQGEPALIYTWSATGPLAVTFSANASNSAKLATATFAKAGTYVFTVTIRDASLQSTTSSVSVTVQQTLTSVTVAPASASVVVHGTTAFSASARDQFGDAMTVQPAFAWTTSGGGTISTAGLFTAGAALGGPFTVTAATGAKSANATVFVTAGQPPSVATTASATPNPTQGTTTALSVLGADDGSEADLKYTWAATGPAPVTFASNGTNAARSNTATFTRAGVYNLTVTLSDVGGQAASSTVMVTVQQKLTSVAITPNSTAVAVGESFTFSGSAADQFGNALTTQPAFTWSTSGGGAISGTGLFTAGGTTGGPYTVTASSGGVSGTASVTVSTGSPPTVATAAKATPNPVTGSTTALSVLGADSLGEGSLSYTWSSAGPAPVTFSANSTNAAKAATATFSAVGTYALTVTIRDAQLLTATSAVTVVVQPTQSTVAVTPPAASVLVGSTFQFTASGADQFGAALVTQPAFAWAVTGGGSVNSSGLFNATTAGGPFTLTATALGQSGSAQISVATTPDTRPPVVSITSPAAGSQVFGVVSLLAFATDDRAVASVSFAVDGAGVGSVASPPYEVAWDTRAVPLGLHRLQARAVDTAGNATDSADVEVEVVAATAPVDVEAPTIRIVSPAAAAEISGDLELKAEAMDNTGVVRVTFSLDGAQVAALSTPPWQASVPHDALEVGPHVITAQAFDAAGNGANAAPVTFVRPAEPNLTGGVSCGCQTVNSAFVWLLVLAAPWFRRQARFPQRGDSTP